MVCNQEQVMMAQVWYIKIALGFKKKLYDFKIRNKLIVVSLNIT